MSTHEASFFVQLRAGRSGSADRIVELRAVSFTQGPPAVVPRDQIAVKLTVRLDDEAFAIATPAAVIIVPKELTRRPAVEVTIDDANDRLAVTS